MVPPLAMIRDRHRTGLDLDNPPSPMEPMTAKFHTAPFVFFGGKRTVTAQVWARLGRPRQYIEPFCGSAAMLLANRHPASLEVIGDQNFYIANFWRAVKYQPDLTACEADYPVSHVDLDARHRWLTEPARTAELRAQLANPEWPGDPRIAGWWVWGQCAWIGSGWCEKEVGDAGQGVQSKIPHVSDAGQGIQSKIPHVGNAGQGIAVWFATLAKRLERVRVIHGDWTRCLNHNYGEHAKTYSGGEGSTAIFFDPPYLGFESLYADGSSEPVAKQVEQWCRENAQLRIALCGHLGDYDLPGWEQLQWDRGKLTYGGSTTTDQECIWFSPPCAKVAAAQRLFTD